MYLQNILATSVGYSIFSGIAMLISILSLYLYDFILVADDFGKLAIYQAFLLISTSLVGLGVDTLLRKELIISGGNARLLIGYSFSIPIISGLLWLLVAVVCVPFLVSYGVIKDYYMLLIGVGTVICNTFVFYATSVLQARKKIVLHGVATILVPVLSNFIGLFLMFYVTGDWHSRVYGLLLGTGFVACASVYYVLKTEGTHFMWNKLKIIGIFKNGIKVAPQGMMVDMLRRTDILMIGALTSMYYAAQYAMALNILAVIIVFFTAIQYAFEVYWYETLDNKGTLDTNYILWVYVRLLIIFILVALVFGTLGGYVILYFLDVDLHKSIDYIPYLSITAIFQALQVCLSLSLIYYHKLNSFPYIYISAALINVVLNIKLISVFGAIGAAYATLIVSGVSFVVQLYVVIKCLKLVTAR